MRKMKIVWFIFICCAWMGSLIAQVKGPSLYMDALLSGEGIDAPGPLNVEGTIRRLVQIINQEGSAAAMVYAQRMNIPYSPEKGIRVELSAQIPLRVEKGASVLSPRAIDQAMERLSHEVKDLGGQLLRRYGMNLSCHMPSDQLYQLATNVKAIRVPRPLHAHAISEGVVKMGANRLQNLTPFKGQDVHVCVLDIGFEAYQMLFGSDLPMDFKAYAIREDGDLFDGYHGTACAEIVYDVAPEAKISGLATQYVSDIFAATDWIINNGVDVVSASIGHYYAPGDGTGYESELAKEMKNSGIVYVASAGNEGEDHWSGTFSDPDGNGWHNFKGNDEILDFYVPAFTVVRNILRWDDWGSWNPTTLQWAGAKHDYDLYLCYKDPSTGVWTDLPDASSFNRQPQYPEPIETAGGYFSYTGLTWGLKIRRHNASRNVFFNLFVLIHTTMEYANSNGSIGIPADAPDIIAVGASDALTDRFHSYSSQGPTLDGRVKPDVAAPSGISTSSYTFGPGNFYGTSASCPHMAGLIALFKSKTPYDVHQIVELIYGRVLDLGSAGLDNLFGRGRIQVSQ